jgi:pyruvate kinase
MTGADDGAAHLKRTKIVATVGPASSSRETLREMILAGVDVFRINFSHGTELEHRTALESIRAVEAEVGRPVAICADLCGPKIRVGVIQGGEVTLRGGDEIEVVRLPVEGNSKTISTTLAELVDVVRPGQHILLADGRLRLQVTDCRPPEKFTCRVVVGGVLASGKGVNLPDTDLPFSALTEKDHRDLDWIAPRDFDYVALSFVRSASDLEQLRGLLAARGSRAQQIAKIEKPQALQDLTGIIQAADVVMVARGDLGVEMDYPSVPIVQKIIARRCQAAGRPCIIATEMMESMIESPRPTRAEVSDVANAVVDHADAVMLSAESSVGRYPVESVRAMQRTVRAAEQFLDEYEADSHPIIGQPATTAALAASIRTIMKMQPIRAIAVYTVTGTTARLISRNRPTCPILVLADSPRSARRVALYYGTVPHVLANPGDAAGVLREAILLAKRLKMASPGEHILAVVAQPVGGAMATNSIVVQQVT